MPIRHTSATPPGPAAPDAATIHQTTNTAPDQRARVLAALRKGPHSTLDLRSKADVLCPASRVMELRRAGANIVTAWAHRATDSGHVHRVAVYALIAEAPAGGAT